MAKKKPLTTDEIQFIRQLAGNVRGQPSQGGIAASAVADALQAATRTHGSSQFSMEDVKKVLDEVSQIAKSARATLDQM